MTKYKGPLNGVMMEEKKSPFSGGLANEKTTFRVASALDHTQETEALRAVFAYKGTDKGVAK